MEAFRSGSRVTVPAWYWGWAISSVKRLGLLPWVQGCAGEADLGSFYREGVPTPLSAAFKVYDLELSPDHFSS